MTCPWGDLEEGIVRKNEFRILSEDGELNGHRRVPPAPYLTGMNKLRNSGFRKAQ